MKMRVVLSLLFQVLTAIKWDKIIAAAFQVKLGNLGSNEGTRGSCYCIFAVWWVFIWRLYVITGTSDDQCFSDVQFKLGGTAIVTYKIKLCKNPYKAPFIITWWNKTTFLSFLNRFLSRVSAQAWKCLSDPWDWPRAHNDYLVDLACHNIFSNPQSSL